MWWKKTPVREKTRREELAEARDSLQRQIEILRYPSRRMDYTAQSARLVADLRTTLDAIERELAGLAPDEG